MLVHMLTTFNTILNVSTVMRVNLSTHPLHLLDTTFIITERCLPKEGISQFPVLSLSLIQVLQV